MKNFFESSILQEKQIKQQFNYEGETGIPYLIKCFKNFDFLNNKTHRLYYNGIDSYKKDITLIEETHLLLYLQHKDFCMNSLQNKELWIVFHCIFIFVLKWSDQCLQSFIKRHPLYERLFSNMTVNGVFNYKNEPYIMTGLLRMSKFFKPPAHFSCKPIFRLARDENFDKFMKQFYYELKNGCVTNETIDILENNRIKPYFNVSKGNIKYITGTSCVGKTTFTKKLTERGWIIKNRGSIGGFPGKSHSPAAVASLHATLTEILSKNNVIGDRGHIDNTLWYFMMHSMGNNTDSLYKELIKFIENEMNEPTIKFYSSHKVIVFIETDIKQNQERMIKRAEGSDIHRAQIKNYALIQSFCYTFMALLNNWKIICVPYENNEFKPEKYNEVINIADELFGNPVNEFDNNAIISRVESMYVMNFNYAKSASIFK